MRTIRDFIRTEGIAALLHKPIVASLDENEETVFVSRRCIEREAAHWADETNENAARYIHRFYGGAVDCDAFQVEWISSNALVVEPVNLKPADVEIADAVDRRDSTECPHCRRRHYPKAEIVWRERESHRLFCAVCVTERLPELFAAAADDDEWDCEECRRTDGFHEPDCSMLGDFGPPRESSAGVGCESCDYPD